MKATIGEFVLEGTAEEISDVVRNVNVTTKVPENVSVQSAEQTQEPTSQYKKTRKKRGPNKRKKHNQPWAKCPEDIVVAREFFDNPANHVEGDVNKRLRAKGLAKLSKELGRSRKAVALKIWEFNKERKELRKKGLTEMNLNQLMGKKS